MFFLISVDVFWNDKKKFKGVNCNGVINKIECNIEYPNERMMRIFCNNLKSDYLHKDNLIVDINCKYYEK
jgi:hypothetical protein